DHETLITLRGRRFMSYGDKFLPPLLVAQQHINNVITNARTFLARDFHMKSGMKYLIESFYRSIAHGGPLPIPYRQILLTARIMDAIFDQLPIPVGSAFRRTNQAKAGSHTHTHTYALDGAMHGQM